MFFSKFCPFSLQYNLAAEFRVPVLQKYGKYLGMTSDWGRSKHDMFSWILGKVTAKLEGWKELLLSKVGKEILLKSVIQAIPHYAMSMFKLPISLCCKIEQKISNFLWRNSTRKAGVHWQNWDLRKTSKLNGGLGFHDLITFNEALLGKQAWRLLQQPQLLWCRLFKGLYFQNKDFLYAENGTRPSWGW